MIYLQLSTGQSPAECQIFARFALRQILREAEAAGVAAELLSQTTSKHGILSVEKPSVVYSIPRTILS